MARFTSGAIASCTFFNVASRDSTSMLLTVEPPYNIVRVFRKVSRVEPCVKIRGLDVADCVLLSMAAHLQCSFQELHSIHYKKINPTRDDESLNNCSPLGIAPFG